MPTDVGESLPGVEQQRQRQMRPRAGRMPGLELRDLILGPGVNAVALALELPHAERGIDAGHLERHRVVEQMTQHLEQIVGRFRRVRLAGDQAGDVLMGEARDRLVAMVTAEALGRRAALPASTLSASEKSVCSMRQSARRSCRRSCGQRQYCSAALSRPRAPVRRRA